MELTSSGRTQILPTMLNLAAIRREVTIGLLPGTLEGAGQPRVVITNVVLIDWLTAPQVDLANVLLKKSAPANRGATGQT
jgi:hypothetical protein